MPVKPFSLDPRSHGEAALRFARHFDLTVREAGLDFLAEIGGRFSKIPYENLSKIIKRRGHFEDWGKLRLPEEVLEDHVREGLGGTCFSLTYCLYTILVHFGFSCYPVTADMKSGRNVHSAVVVRLDRDYLVDPGYVMGSPLPIGPEGSMLKMEHAGVRLAQSEEPGVYDVFTFDSRETKWRYRFKNEPEPLDRFLNNWLSSFEWNSMRGLCLTKAEHGRMVYVHKQFMRETNWDGKKNRSLKRDYHAAIEEVFGIRAERVEEALAAIQSNMQRERELGLWTPKKEWRPAL
jgi:arylamine N-acetyltransferase